MCDEEHQVLQIFLWVALEQCLYLWSTLSSFQQLKERAEMTVTCKWEILMQIQNQTFQEIFIELFSAVWRIQNDKTNRMWCHLVVTINWCDSWECACSTVCNFGEITQAWCCPGIYSQHFWKVSMKDCTDEKTENLITRLERRVFACSLE